jgi:dihydrofolate reductase
MKISIYIATSINGYISNSRNVPDWLSSQYGQGLFAICREKQAVIMGKKTYDILAPDNLPLQDSGITVVLTSQTEVQPANPTVVFANESPAKIVAMVEEKGFSEAVIIGGAATISDFLNAGLVNDLFVIVEPILLGGECLPLLRDVPADYKMQLVDSTRLGDSTLQLHYQMA